jgi:hypothetical protein
MLISLFSMYQIASLRSLACLSDERSSTFVIYKGRERFEAVLPCNELPGRFLDERAMYVLKA